MPFSEAALRARWKFILGGAAFISLNEMHHLMQRDIPINAQNVTVLTGTALGGALLGWVVWYVWARSQQ